MSGLETPTGPNEVIVVSWTEWEEGWGPRPMGYSYHLSAEKARQFIAEEEARSTEIHISEPDAFYVIQASDSLRRLIKKNKGSYFCDRAAH